MPTIRWLGLYGSYRTIHTIHYGPSRIMPSLTWELTQKDREVAAEWTIATREFVVPKLGLNYSYSGVGLLVESSAVIRKFRYDSYTYLGRYYGTRNNKKEKETHEEGHRKLNWKTLPKKYYDKTLEKTRLWEAICYPRFKAIVISPHLPDNKLSDVIFHAEKFNLPVLIYQAQENSDSQVSVKRAFILEKI